MTTTDRAAILSSTMRFLTAGGLTLAIALAREIARTDRDWALMSTMMAGVLVGTGRGAYGRITAQGPISSILPRQGG